MVILIEIEELIQIPWGRSGRGAQMERQNKVRSTKPLAAVATLDSPCASFDLIADCKQASKTSASLLPLRRTAFASRGGRRAAETASPPAPGRALDSQQACSRRCRALRAPARGAPSPTATGTPGGGHDRRRRCERKRHGSATLGELNAEAEERGKDSHGALKRKTGDDCMLRVNEVAEEGAHGDSDADKGRGRCVLELRVDLLDH